MTVALAQRLFGTTLATFQTARRTRYVAPDAAARIPDALRASVTGVVGLDTGTLVSAPAERAPDAAAFPRRGDFVWGDPVAVPGTSHASASTVYPPEDVSGYQRRTGSPAGCRAATNQAGFTPNQYLSAYGYTPLHDANIQGQGERVALIEIDGFRYSDIRAFPTASGCRNRRSRASWSASTGRWPPVASPPSIWSCSTPPRRGSSRSTSTSRARRRPTCSAR